MTSMIYFHNKCQVSDVAVITRADYHLVVCSGIIGILIINKYGNDASISIDMSGSVLWWYADYPDTLGNGSVESGVSCV